MTIARRLKANLIGGGLAAAMTLLGPIPATAAPDDVVNIPDPVLLSCVHHELARDDFEGPADVTAPVTKEQVSTIWSLTCTQEMDHPGVGDLTGLEYFNNLQSLTVLDGTFTDLSPLAGLTTLDGLTLDGALISDLTPLAGLTKLEDLSIYGGSFSDLSPLEGMAELGVLDIVGAQISDLSPLADLDLEWIRLADNQIEDLNPLTGMPLNYLDVEDNDISDVTPLLGQEAWVDTSRNHISDLSPLAPGSTGFSEDQTVDLGKLIVGQATENPIVGINGLPVELEGAAYDASTNTIRPTEVGTQELKWKIKLGTRDLPGDPPEDYYFSGTLSFTAVEDDNVAADSEGNPDGSADNGGTAIVSGDTDDSGATDVSASKDGTDTDAGASDEVEGSTADTAVNDATETGAEDGTDTGSKDGSDASAGGADGSDAATGTADGSDTKDGTDAGAEDGTASSSGGTDGAESRADDSASKDGTDTAAGTADGAGASAGGSDTKDGSDSKDGNDQPPAKPSLSVSDQTVSVSDFLDPQKGAVLNVANCSADEVRFQVFAKNKNVTTFDKTVATDDKGSASVNVYGTGTDASAYLGDYTVEVTCGDVILKGAFSVVGDDANAGEGSAASEGTAAGESTAGSDGSTGGGNDGGSSLPRTGAELTALSVGVGLLIAGAVSIVLARRRNKV